MLAIVIPYYKINYFEETLQSLSNQTDKRFKVYIGNDNSNDDPIPIIEKYKQHLDLKYKKFDDNLGSISLVQQWNRCLDLLENEEWVMILGDDDFLSPTVVQSFYDNHQEFSEKSNVIRFATRKVFDDKIDPDVYVTHPIWEKASDGFYRKLTKQTISSLSEYIFSRKSYLKYKFHYHNLME